MSEENKIEAVEAIKQGTVAPKTRRAFVKTAAVAVTAPAVMMILDASTKPASAATVYGTPI